MRSSGSWTDVRLHRRAVRNCACGRGGARRLKPDRSGRIVTIRPLTQRGPQSARGNAHPHTTRYRNGTGSNNCDGGAGTDGGVGCETTHSQAKSIALLRFARVSLHRAATGATTCDMHARMINDGSEPAKK